MSDNGEVDAGLIIRPCEAADIPGVLAVSAACVEEGLVYGLTVVTLDEVTARLGTYCYVATHGKEIVAYAWGVESVSEGMAVIPRDAPYLEVEELMVKPGCRDQGIGGLLLDTLLQAARDRGIDRFLVYSANQDTERIMRFYGKHGFRSWCVMMYR